MKLKLILLLFFLTISNFTFSQVRFESSVSKKTLGLNERLRVDFEMNQDGDNFKNPSFSGFTVVGGPNQSVSNRWVNGQRTYSKTYSFFLQPTRRGKFTIGQAEITIDGETYKTSPLAVEVTAAVDEPKDGNNTDLIASDNLHLVAEISNSNPYLNEAITVVYKLYVSPRVSVTNWRELDIPKYSDFWSQNMDIQQLKIENGEFRGEPYRFVVLRRTILYPQKTGELDIEPLTLSVAVDVPSDRRDIFGGRLYETVEKTVAAGSRTINVKSLPQENRPASFAGAVGRFNLKVTGTRSQLAAGESLTAKVEVSGNGNLKLFEIPKIEVPANVELYEPERTENVRTNLNGTQGSVADSYTIVPTQQGEFSIPAINFSYFDPSTGSYQTLNSQELNIQVDQGPGGRNVIASGGSTTNRQPIAAPTTQFKYNKLSANLRAIDDEGFFNSVAFWSLMSLPVLMILGAIFFGKKREERAGDIRGNRMRKANKLAKKYLFEAKKNLGDQKSFYISLERALHNYLKAKLHITTSEMSKEKIESLLQTKGAETQEINDFLELLKSCEFARYAPSSNVTMEQDYNKASQVISTLDKQLHS